MEKELNIAEILKDKPNGTKLWSDIFGELIVDCIDEQNDYFPIRLTVRCGNNICLTKDGCYYSYEAGTLPCIVPSKSMRDWSKFAWKKGDVLVSNGKYIIFEKWANNSYTTFLGVFDSIDNNSLICLTSVWEKETNEVQINKYISQIEKNGGGKLNLSTLEIDKQKQEFKDGDIVVLDEIQRECYAKCILAIKNIENGKINYYAFINLFNNDVLLNGTCFDKREPHLATEEEKQQLFDALAKEGKRWNSDTKQIEDLPKKCEFKPFDKVLVKHEVEYEWMIDFFSHYDKDDEMPFVCMTGRAVKCIPYNDQTAHLLGTTDDWKGGEG